MPHRAPEIIGGIPVIKSALLEKIDGLAHGFPCKSGPRNEPVEATAARLSAAFGLEDLFMAKQNHGVDEVHYDGDPKGLLALRDEEGDILMTRAPMIAAAVRTADCVPILLVDPESGAVAAVHAGWRGIVAGVVEVAVAKMTEIYKSKPDKIVAAIGPHIRQCCFEVGPEVAREFDSKFGSSIIAPGKKDKSYVDLAASVKIAAARAGLLPDNIDDVEACTFCEEKLFFSYRRDGPATGRQINIVYRR